MLKRCILNLKQNVFHLEKFEFICDVSCLLNTALAYNTNKELMYSRGKPKKSLAKYFAFCSTSVKWCAYSFFKLVERHFMIIMYFSKHLAAVLISTEITKFKECLHEHQIWFFAIFLWSHLKSIVLKTKLTLLLN